MGQVTIYLEDEIEQKMIVNARAMKQSKSKWVANVIREKLTEEWPATVRELPGSWEDFPAPEELHGTEQADVKRESL